MWTTMTKWHGGKGATQRPQTKGQRETYERNWDRIFGKSENSMKHYDELEQMLNDYVEGLLVLCEQCPVNHIDEYEVGNYNTKGPNCSVMCYRLADRIVQIRDQKQASEEDTSVEAIRNKRIHK